MKAVIKSLPIFVCLAIFIGCQTRRADVPVKAPPFPAGDLSIVPRENNLLAPDVRTFLITAGSQISSPRASLKIEPWLVAGVTNLDRSPEFLNRLRASAAKSNLVAQSYLGLLLLTVEDTAPNRTLGYALLKSAAAQGFLPAMNELGYIDLFGKYGAQHNAPNGIYWLREAAEKGFADAQQQLAICYEHGYGVRIDFSEVYKWAKLAAAQKHPVGLGCLGVCYLEGRGATKDFELAEKNFQEATALGNTRAKLNLGLLYTEKGYKTNEFQRGVELIHEAAEAGDFRAQVCFANLNIWGKGMPQNPTNFVEWTRKAAAAGFVDAELNLGRFLASDKFGMQNLPEARRWLLLAAAQNQPEACYIMGGLLASGQGGPTNQTNALALFRRAAELGHRDSQFRVALANINGRGTPTNEVEGITWLRRSAASGWPPAEYMLGACYSSGSYGLLSDTNTAVQWIRKAADHGEINAQYEMASTYLFGKYGVSKDIPAALQWFQKAADQGHPASQNSVGYGIETGVNGPIDFVEAYKWYELAVRQNDPTAKINMRRLIERMNPSQIAEATKRADEFKPHIEVFAPGALPPQE
jgi:TPR repeat protein